MKLRLRSHESKETLKLEVPDSCSLQQLKDTLSRAMSSSSSSSSSSFLHLSLNRKDEIHASDDDESLRSIGITSGDLIFYSLNPNSFSPETLVHKPGPSQVEPSNHVAQETQDHHPSTQGPMEVEETDISDDVPDAEQLVISESMEFSEDSLDVMAEKISEPFMKRVLREVLGDNPNDHKLLVSAVHAVIVESGFVLLDKISGMAVEPTHLLDQLPLKDSPLSFTYTLPEILADGPDATKTVVLKFRSLGHNVIVYGSLSVGGSGSHRICLDKHKFAPAFKLMLANSDSNDNSTSTGDGHPENEVFQLWKTVKDGLQLPLLIDLCEKAGLSPPPCFMRLPTELKLKILEYLPGEDIAKVACVCTEMRYLSSDNDLWKKKFEDVFGQGKAVPSRCSSYKGLFAQTLVNRRNLSKLNSAPRRKPYLRFIRDPRPFGKRFGGNYDVFPVTLRHPGLPFPTFQHRKFSPACDLLE